jgi:hypothetical protein
VSAQRDYDDATLEELERLAEERRRRLALEATNDRAALCREVDERLGLTRAKLVEVVRYRASGGNHYRLTFDGERVAELTTAELLARVKARPRIADAVDDVVTTPPAEWDDLARLIMRAATDEDIGATDAELCRSWLQGYALDGYETSDPADLYDGAARVLMRDEGRYVHGDSLRRWVVRTTDERGVTSKRMGVVLKAGGCALVNLALRLGPDERTTRKLWRLPED